MIASMPIVATFSNAKAQSHIESVQIAHILAQ